TWPAAPRCSGTRRRSSPRPRRTPPRRDCDRASRPWPSATPGSSSCAPWSDSQLAPLAAQVVGNVLVDIVEHRAVAEEVAVGERSEALGLLLRRQHFGLELLLQFLVLF